MGEKVTVGVSGGVAAYKAAELVRALQEHGLDVHVVMTRGAEEFVRPLTFAALTGHKVITSLWTEGEGGPIEHIAEAQSTQLLVVAPATAHTLAKFAHGLADDFLSTMYLATTAPVIVAPAMNVNMWNHPATVSNLRVLGERGVEIVEPESGYLACGMTGGGRLAPVETIARAVVERLRRVRDLTGETVLITAGGTREPLDPVRFLGNRSSGKMGYALAAQAARRGARVVLVSAPSALAVPAGCSLVPVVTAGDMQAAVLAALPEATILIAAAAVADFRAAEISTHKMKRECGLLLQLEPTEDIVRAAVAAKRPGTTVVAFAAETENLLANAHAKLLRKGVDAVVANDISVPGLGFDADRNAGFFVTSAGATELPACSKMELADRILDRIVDRIVPLRRALLADAEGGKDEVEDVVGRGGAGQRVQLL